MTLLHVDVFQILMTIHDLQYSNLYNKNNLEVMLLWQTNMNSVLNIHAAHQNQENQRI